MIVAMRFVAVPLTLAALWLAGTLQASAASPDRLPFPSKISIHSAELQFSGRVRSPVYRPCRARRRVVLFQMVQGGSDRVLGRTRTDGRGRWRIRLSGFAGISLARFYARVRPGRQELAQVPILCSPARSRTVKLTG
jgi:hypothetical protein